MNSLTKAEPTFIDSKLCQELIKIPLSKTISSKDDLDGKLLYNSDIHQIQHQQISICFDH